VVGVTVDPVERRPERSGVALVGALALLSAATTAAVVPALALALVGALGVTAGTARGSGLGVGAGLAGLLGALGLAGLAGVGAEPLLVGTAAAVLAWDAGVQAIDLAATVGRAADSSRALVVHTAVSTLAAAVLAVVGYAVFRLADAATPRPASAVVLLALGAVLLALLLRG
jgi:hypothetical protein